MLMLENKYPKVVVHNRAPNYHADRVHIIMLYSSAVHIIKKAIHAH